MKALRDSISTGLCLLLLLPSSALALFSSTPQDLNEAAGRLAEALKENIPQDKTVAVREFSAIEGDRTLLGVRIQDLLTNALAAQEGRRYTVVERLQLAELDTERMMYGETHGDDLDQWARRLKAELVVLGTYILSDETLKLDCRIVEPETGRTLGATHAGVTLNRAIRRLASTPAPATPSSATPPA